MVVNMLTLIIVMAFIRGGLSLAPSWVMSDRMWKAINMRSSGALLLAKQNSWSQPVGWVLPEVPLGLRERFTWQRGEGAR